MRTLFERGVRKLREFDIEIVKLQPGKNQFEFVIDDKFFQFFEYGLIERGGLKANVEIDKSIHLLNIHFSIDGEVELTCDRSLEKFNHPLFLEQDLIVKYGEEEDFLSDEVMIIKRDEQVLNLANLIYEYITVAVPIKKVHPKFLSENIGDEEEDQLIYSSGNKDDEEDKNDESIDPRWKELLKLKNNK